MHSARERLAMAAMVTLLVFAVGCSDDSGGSGDKADGKSGSPTSSATTGSPESPGSASASGSPQASGSGAPAPSDSGTSRPSDSKGSAAKTLTAAQLKAAFVVTADLPSGWRVAAPEVEKPDVTPVDKPACQPLMDMMGGGGVTRSSAARISGDLTPPGAAEAQYAISLASYQPGVAETLLADVKAAIPSCGTFRAGKPSLTYAVTPLPAPNAGDDSVAFKVSADFGLSATMTATRTGSVIVQGASQSADQTMPPAILKTQTDKVAAAQRG